MKKTMMSKTARKPKVSDAAGIDFMEQYTLTDDYQASLIEEINLKIKPANSRKKFNAESESAKKFFFEIENAISSFIFDKEMSSNRPTAGQSIEALKRIIAQATQLDKQLESIDYLAEKELVLAKFDIKNLRENLGELIDEVDGSLFAESEKKARLISASHPLRILVSNVIKGLVALGAFCLFKTKAAKVSVICVVIQVIMDYIDEQDNEGKKDSSEDGNAYSEASLYRYINPEIDSYLRSTY